MINNNPPGHGSHTARASPEAPADNHRALQRTMIGLVSAGAIAATGIGWFIYQNLNGGHVEKTNTATARDVRAKPQAQDLTATRREIEIQVAARTADQVAGETAERPAVELEQALQQERDKAQKLARELAATRHILETQATALAETEARKTDSQQLTILKQALRDAEESTATYQELLVQERTRNQSLEQRLLTKATPDRGSATADRSGSPGVAPAPDNPAATPSPAVDKPVIVASADNKSVTMMALPAIPKVTDTPEVARLMARASQLLIVGDVAAARIVLDRAVESGDVQALFALAETYDPLSLSAWGTLGTRGDVAKARELYSKALAGGVQEAKDRLNALGE